LINLKKQEMSENKKINKKSIDLALAYWQSKKAHNAKTIVDLIDDAADESIHKYESRMRNAVHDFHISTDVLTTLKNIEDENNKK
jgi:macrodomain Ter protein organizer (MatP/YcbG family)